MKKVKRIEVVPLEDLPKAKVIMSLANLWAVDVGKGKTKYEGDDLKFAYLDDKTSEVVSKKFRGMVFSIRAFKDGFSDTNLLPVKIHYHDGSWEYGLKWWEDRDIVYQRNRRLVSLFVKSGYVNDHNEEIEDAADTDRDSRIPAWILDLLPRYNEKIRDAGLCHRAYAVLRGEAEEAQVQGSGRTVLLSEPSMAGNPHNLEGQCVRQRVWDSEVQDA